jgi:hypothetical protein
MTNLNSIIGALALILLSGPSASAQTSSQSFHFGAIGDTGYSKKSEEEFTRMIRAMNTQPLAFVVHVGDFQADPRPYHAAPERVSMPCPLERLARVREVFFPQGRSLGQRTMTVESQAQQSGFAKFRENLAWSHNGVGFMTMHITGSNDNKGRTPEMDAEAAERTQANIAWMKKAFADAKARNSLGLVLVTQANPGFETHWTPSLKDRYFRLFPGVTLPKELPASGFDDILHAVEAEMQTYDKPVLFIHGDTHIFHVSKPLVSKKTRRFVDNFTRLEVFGDPESHWVRVTVDPARAELFVIEPQIIPENRVGR